MKSITIKSALAIAVVTIAGLSSCQKEKVSTPVKTTNKPVVDQSLTISTQTYQDIHTIIASLMVGSYKKEGVNTVFGGCATVTNDTVSVPHVAVIDFGTGCTGSNGKVRSGKIIVQYESSDPTLAGNDVYATYEGFRYDTIGIEGTIHVAVNGLNGIGNTTVSVTSTNTQLINGAGDTAQLNVTYDAEWLAGSSTPRDINDDLFDMTGSITGTDFGGNVASATITSPLRKNFDDRCNYFMDGVVEIRIAGSPDKTLDYTGSGCSGLVQVTENGVTTTENQ